MKGLMPNGARACNQPQTRIPVTIFQHIRSPSPAGTAPGRIRCDHQTGSWVILAISNLERYSMKKFIITGTYRTGSSALAELIGLHPDISCGWEWTGRVSWPWKIEVGKRSLGGDFSSLTEDQKRHMESTFAVERHLYLGYRTLFRASNKWVMHPKYSAALFLDQFAAHLEWWRNSRIAIVHIIRTDNVAWLKSVGLAKATGSYFGRVYPDKLTVKWNLKEAEKRVIAKNWIDEKLSTLRNCDVPFLQVKYEDFLADNRSSVKEVCALLNCRWPYVPVGEPAAKVQSESSKATIENMGELRTYLEERGLDKGTSGGR